MKRASIFLLLLTLNICAFPQEKIIPVVLDGDEVNYLQEESKAVAKGNVKVVYKDIILYCDEIIYDTKTNSAEIKGNVKIVTEKGTLYGDYAVYDFTNQQATIKDLRVQSPPMYGRAEDTEKVSSEKYVIKRGYVTTCDLDEPHYRLVAKRITIYPGKKVVAKNVILKVGNTPIFYLPYYSQPLTDDSFPMELVPGRNKEWGGYVLTRWRYHINEQNRGKVHVDYYSKRGIGAGATHKMETKNYGQGLFKVYGIQDKVYKAEQRHDRDSEFSDLYPERRNLDPGFIEDDRYKLQASHSWQPSAQLSIISELNKFSDEYFMKDFFEKEYQIEPHPLTYNLIDYSFSRSSLSLLTQKRVNTFFTETEYLPQLTYDFYRQPILNSPFYLESRTSAGYLRKRYKDFSAEDQHAMRIHTHNVFSYPMNIAWLHVTPYVGNYTTYYSENAFKNDDVIREAFEQGISMSTKVYRTMDTNFSIFGQKVEQMRHIITPQFRYSYIHDPSASPDTLIPFDSIDELERVEKIVFALGNKLQAKDGDRVWDFLYFSPSVEYRIHQEGKGSYFDNIKLDLEFYPKRSFSLTGNAKYDVVDRAVQEANLDVTWRDTKNKKFTVSFGQRYARGETSQSSLGLTYKINPKLEFKNYLRFENKTGEFKEQEYVLRTDLHCWLMDVGLNVDEQREGIRDFTIWLVFRLKAFPDVRVGFDHTYHGAKSSY